ncbi:MAG: hypothetical protein ACFFCZ_09900 [Promethearchaeota archaeon]
MVPRRTWLKGLSLLMVMVSGGTVLSFVLLFEASNITWMYTYGGAGSDYVHHIIARNNGEFVLEGNINGSQLLGLDAAGAVRWNDSTIDSIFDLNVVSTSDGGLLLLGTRGLRFDELYVCRLDAQRVVMWEQTFDHPHADLIPYQIYTPAAMQTTDGDFLVASLVADSHVVARERTWVLRLNSNGFPLWNVSYYSHAIFLPNLLQLSDKNIVLAGPEFWGEDAILLSLDLNGTLLWNQTYGGSGPDCIYSALQTKDGGFALAGYTKSFGAGERDAWLLRTDSQGHLLWYRTYGGAASDETRSIVQTEDEGFALAGTTESFGAGESDAWLLRTDAKGDILWEQTYGGASSDMANALLQTADEGFVLAGRTESFGDERGDAWVFKTDKFGHISQLPSFLASLMVIGWVLSIGGALGFGILTADHFLRSRKAKEPSPTNSEDSLSRVP